MRGAEAVTPPLLPVPDGTGGAGSHLDRLLMCAGGEWAGRPFQLFDGSFEMIHVVKICAYPYPPQSVLGMVRGKLSPIRRQGSICFERQGGC